MTNFFNVQKALFWGHFGPFVPKVGKVFPVKRTQSVFKYSDYLLPKKQKKTNDKFLRRMPN